MKKIMFILLNELAAVPCIVNISLETKVTAGHGNPNVKSVSYGDNSR